MRRLLLIAAVSALTVAKPGLYKEKEDFQYSRSSSDDGTKSGFYGAQRGNMGGNFERAHNMDGLAQHQMNGLVKQVEGELGDGSKTRTGSVFTAANSQGIYGSGHYDLSNLEGRNFQEGSSYGNSQSHSSLTSQSGYDAQSSGLNNAAYSSSHSHSSRHHSGYHSSGSSGQASHLQESTGYSGHENDLQAADRVNQYDYGGQVASGQYSRYHGQSAYDQTRSNSRLASGYDSNTQSRVIAMPVRVVVRPGTRVAIPLTAQTYDASQYGATYDQNSANNQAEVLTNHDQQTVYKPSNEPKQYESAYSYHKEWEKHDTIPVSVLEASTVSPFPKNSELYEDTQAHTSGHEYDSTGTDSQKSHSSGTYSRYNADVKSAFSGQSHHQSNYNNQYQRASSAINRDAYLHDAQNAAVNTNNQIEDVSKPKSYQSSYSYHKSWEQQGDPYVIKPASNGVYDGQASQRLTAASSNQGTWSSQQYGNRYHSNRNYINGEDCDCDENGHIRVARSYNLNHNQEVHPYQQNQNYYDQVEQQSQNVEDLGQQTQSKWDNLEDLGQQTQNKWDNIENLGQQTQSMSDKLEDLGQQTQSKWDNLEDLGQQTQNKWDKVEDLGQQTQSMSDKLEDLGQQTQTHLEDLGQQTQNQWDKIENTGQQIQNKWDNLNEQTNQHNQQTQNSWSTLETGKQDIYGQQTQNTWHNSYTPPQETHVENASPQGIFNQPKYFSNEDFKPQLAQNQNVDEHAPHSWNSLDPKPTHTNENTGGIRVHDYPYNFNTNPTYFHNIGYNNMPRGFEQTDSQDYFRQHSQIYNSNWNTHTGSRIHNSWQEQFAYGNPPTNLNYQTSTQHTSALSSLWDKIDNIEKQSTTSTNNDTVETNENSFGQTFQKPYINPGQNQTGSDGNVDLPQTHHTKPFRSHYAGNHQSQTNIFNEITSTTDIHNDQSNGDHIHTSDIGRGDIGPNDSSNETTVTDIGRGDIGLDDSSNDKIATSTTETTFHTMLIPGSIYKSNKTPEEIEALSLQNITNTTITENTSQNSAENSLLQSSNPQANGSLSTINDNELSSTEYQPNSRTSHTLQFQNPQIAIEKEESLNKIPSRNTSSDKNNYLSSDKTSQHDTTLKSTDPQNYKNQGPAHVNQQMTGKQSNDFGLQPVNKYQLNPKLDIEQQQSETEQNNLENVDQKDAEQQSETQVATFIQPKLKNFHQHNTNQQFETFDKEIENLTPQNPHYVAHFGQKSDTLDQQNTDQQFETLGQQSENVTPQQADNFKNVGLQNSTFEQQNTDQEFKIFGLQRENLTPENNQDNLINLEQQISTFDQQNTDQQLQTFGQQSENMNPQNADNFKNVGLQNSAFDQQNTDQEFKTFGQQSENLTPENSQDNLINVEQQISTFDQQNTDQQLETFSQQSENLTPQNADDLINLEQQISTFDQQNTDQQFETLDQQNAGNLNNLEQQINSFDQQNIDEQFENHGTSNRNLIPENADNLINLEQQINSFDQQDMAQQFEALEKPNKHMMQNADNLVSWHKIDRLDQQNMNQQLDTFDRSNENPTPQNTDNMRNLEQHSDTFEQQNIPQQFENFGQENDNFDQQSQILQGEHLDNFGQQVLTAWEPTEEIQQSTKLEVLPHQNTHKAEEYSPHINNENQNEQIVKSVESIPQTNKNIDSPPEPITEKPGFWASIGNKFTSAKKKVSSWF